MNFFDNLVISGKNWKFFGKNWMFGLKMGHFPQELGIFGKNRYFLQ